MEAILHIGIAQFLFAALLTLTKTPMRWSDLLLGLWLLLMALFMSLTFLKNVFADTFWGQVQVFPFAFTIGPFAYLYVQSLIEKTPRFRARDAIHAIPFVFFLIVANFFDDAVDKEFYQGNPFAPRLLIYSIPILLSFGGYFAVTVKKLNRHRRNILDHFSYQSDRISLNWLRAAIISLSVTLVLTIAAIFINVGAGYGTLNPGVFLFLGFTVFAFGVIFFGVKQPAIWARKEDDRFVDHIQEEKEEEEDDDAEENRKNEKYARSSLSDDDAHTYIEMLMKYMNEYKPFLERDLNIQMVAQALEIPQHHLTQAINQHLKKNFYTLVNEFRVEEVKQRLLDPGQAHFTLLSIAHDSGFNSKSSFNMIFKKFTGMTPTQYRKAHGF